MRKTITISIPEELDKMLVNGAKAKGITKSQYVQDTLRKDLVLDLFEGFRAEGLKRARSLSIFTDEDIFKIVS